MDCGWTAGTSYARRTALLKSVLSPLFSAHSRAFTDPGYQCCPLCCSRTKSVALSANSPYSTWTGLIRMTLPFSRTLRAIEADGRRRPTLKLLVFAALLGVWSGWFLLANVAVYEVSETARLEAYRAVHPVAARIEGQVIENRLQIGRRVKAGEVLVALDAESERLALAEAKARLQDLRAQLRALRLEIEHEQTGAKATLVASQVAIEEARAVANAVQARAHYAELRVADLEALYNKRAASEQDLDEARAEAKAQQAELQAGRLSTNRLLKESDVEQRNRQTRIASLKREAVEIEGEATIQEATIRRLERNIERCVLRAPIAGRTDEVREYRVGAVVHVGEKLGSIVPSGGLRAVAYFPVASVGRIYPGQPVRLRLEGFPWTRYGTLTGTVADVGNEPTNGLIRVEVALDLQSPSQIPLAHGLPGTAEVEVERLSPAALVLRAAGKRLSRHAFWRPPHEREASANRP